MPDSGAFGSSFAPQRGTLLHICTGSHDTAFVGKKRWSSGSNLNLQSLTSSQFNRKSNDRWLGGGTGGWIFRLTASSRKVRTKCAAGMSADGRSDVSSCQDFCSLLAPPAVQKRLHFVHLWSCKLFRNRNTNKTPIPVHYAALSWLTHPSLLHTLSLTHTLGTFYRSAVRQELSYRAALQNGAMGILGPTRWWRLIRWQTIKDGRRKKKRTKE